MKHVVCLSYTSSSLNFDHRLKFMDEEIRITRLGVDFSSELMRHLIEQYDGVADVLAFQGLHPTIRLGGKTYRHKESEEFKTLVRYSRLVTGEVFRSVYVPWALRSFLRENSNFFVGKRVGFYSGLLDRTMVEVLSNYTEQLHFYDPVLHLGLKKTLHGADGLIAYARVVAPIFQRAPLSTGLRKGGKRRSLAGTSPADIYISRSSLLERFGFEHLAGKILIVDTLSPSVERQLEEAGVQSILDLQPLIPELAAIQNNSFAIIEGIFQALTPGWEPLSEDGILNFIEELKLKPNYKQISRGEHRARKRKFAFIVHPLSMQDLFRHPAIRPLAPLAEKAEALLEKGASLLPAVKYGTIKGIKSELTGVETEGHIYSIFDTPKMMMNKAAEDTYQKLIKVCEQAAREGTEIIGLGAYTKIVGDAGVTVAKNSPIPVTTGNSLSAAATLWAARDACGKLGFLPPYEHGKIVKGRAMVIGATGSIGAVCAKMLANVCDDLTICSRSADRLLELKEEIQKLAPHCRIRVALNPNKEARACDLIVTSTSAHDRRVLDIMQVKPGCVICDVSRPLDVREEDALKRPDILVIESGEIQLPGQIEMSCDIGTPESVVYACLAETALLSLEGRLESFTLSRHVHYEKVRLIYDLAKKHGAKLASIRGHNGKISDAEIALCREHALAKIKDWKTDEPTKQL
jgi:predicted amino acid dehydrogenase